MDIDTGRLGMTIFLLISACFNLPFFARSIRDVLSPTRFQSMPAAPSALLTTAIAELSWVLPCLVQCALQTFRGNGPWSPQTSRLGCDVMGFYSVFGSVLGMTSTVWVAVITHRAVTGRAPFSAKIGVLTNVALVLGSALFCALPFLGVGSFVYAGEGFCYFDWYDPALASMLMIVVLACMVATCALLAMSVRRGGWPSKVDLYLIGASLLSAWTLWVPACIIGLAGGSFPSRYMLSGGVMGHAQALINPYVYGLRWRRSVLAMGSSGKGILVGAKLGAPPTGNQPVTSLSTPSQDAAMNVSPLPSPPASECGEQGSESALNPKVSKSKRNAVAPHIV